MAECTVVKKERAVDTVNGTTLATIRYTPGHFFFDFNVTVVFRNRLTL